LKLSAPEYNRPTLTQLSHWRYEGYMCTVEISIWIWSRWLTDSVINTNNVRRV